MSQRRLTSTEEVVEYNDIVTHKHQPIDKVRSDESSASSNEDPPPSLSRKFLDGRESSSGSETDCSRPVCYLVRSVVRRDGSVTGVTGERVRAGG